MRQGKWNDLDVNVVGHAPGSVDISVLGSDQVTPTLPLPIGSDGLVVGQDMFFLGFPYGMIADVGPINRGLPFPLVKKGTLSAVTRDDSGGHLLLLDGHNNPGFSGGPVVFSAPGTPATNLRVAGVVSGYRFERKPVMDENRVTDLAVHENTGIIITYDIRHAVEVIRGNPVGAILPSV